MLLPPRRVVLFGGKGVVADLGARLGAYDLASLDREHNVIGSPAEVLADGHAIFRGHCDSHAFASFLAAAGR
jgi:hypothetical protein